MKLKAYKYCFVFWLVFITTAFSDQPTKSTPLNVLTLEQRKKTIQKFQEFIKGNIEVTESKEDFEKILPPFLFDFPPPPKPKEEQAAKVEQQTIKKEEKPPLSEEDLVKRIGYALKPRGSIQQNNLRILFVQGNRKLVVGDKLKIKYREKDYTIEVTIIDVKFFELKLNNTAVKFNY